MALFAKYSSSDPSVGDVLHFGRVCRNTGRGFRIFNSVREMRGIDPVNCTSQNVQSEIEEEYRKEFYGEGQVFFYYKRLGRSTFVNCPLQNMSENNYMFCWPENEILFGYTN